MIEIIVIGGLITWRISNILVKQNGPLHIFAKFRAFLATKQKRMGGMYDFMTCMTCVSMPVAALTAIYPSQSLVQYFAYLLCFSAVSAVTDALTRKS